MRWLKKLNRWYKIAIAGILQILFRLSGYDPVPSSLMKLYNNASPLVLLQSAIDVILSLWIILGYALLATSLVVLIRRMNR